MLWSGSFEIKKGQSHLVTLTLPRLMEPKCLNIIALGHCVNQVRLGCYHASAISWCPTAKDPVGYFLSSS